MLGVLEHYSIHGASTGAEDHHHADIKIARRYSVCEKPMWFSATTLQCTVYVKSPCVQCGNNHLVHAVTHSILCLIGEKVNEETISPCQ